MPAAKSTSFTRLADGTLLRRHTDGTWRPVASATDISRLARASETDIETWSRTDPDHPGLDDRFWAGVDEAPPKKEAISIKLDADVLHWFRSHGRGYQTRMNAVLRRYMDARKKTG